MTLRKGYAAAWLVAIVCMLAVAGCRNGAAPSAETAIAPSSAPGNVSGLSGSDAEGEPIASAKPIVLGFSQLGSESDWRMANTRSIQDAAKEAGIRLVFENAEQSQQKQFEAIRSFIRQKVDVIAVAPVVQSGWEPILKEVKAAGIPVIISDRSIDVQDSSLYVTFIGADFYEEGRKAGKYILDKTRDMAGPIGIAELKGTEGSSPSIERGKGFMETIASRPELTIVQSEFADFTVSKGKERMKEILKAKGQEIKVLFAHNDDMALGAIEAIEEYGLRPGKDIYIVSVDGTRKAFEMLIAGKINCVVECNPLLGPNLMQAVTEVMQGRTLPKRIVPSESVFTEQTAKKFAAERKY